MSEPKAKEIKDRVLIKIRNPYNNQYIQKSFRHDMYGTKENAELEAQKWKEETLNLLKEKNQLMGNTQPITTGVDTKKKLKKQVEELTSKGTQGTQGTKVTQGPQALVSSDIQPSVPAPAPAPVVPVVPFVPLPEAKLSKKAFPFDTWIPAKTGASLTIVSKSKGGKTSFLKKIVSNLPKDVICILITPNFQNEIYESMKKKAVVSPIYDHRIIKLVQRINQKTKNEYKFLILLDDVIDQKNNSSLLKAFLTLRNANISVILSVQSTMLVSKLVRNNQNYTLLGRLQGEEAIKDAYEKFLSNYAYELGVKKKEDIYKIYPELTDDYNFIFVNNLKEKIYQTNRAL